MRDADQAPSTRRSVRQNRRAGSEAGTPRGQASARGFIEIPAAGPEPADIASRTGAVPLVAPDRPEQTDPGERTRQPRTRREARRLRELGLLPDRPEQDVTDRSHPTRRADAPLTSVTTARTDGGEAAHAEPSLGGVDAAVALERRAIAEEAAALAELLSAADHSDPHAVDPEIHRRQQALAERAATLNAQGEESSSGPEPVPPAHLPQGTGSERQSPVEAAHAHGLDSLAASEATSPERTILLIAALVLAIGLIALVAGLIMINT